MKGNTIQRAFRRSALRLRRASPTILSGMALLGLIVTTVEVIKDTRKAAQLLEEAEEQKGEKLTTVEAVQTAAPVYIPSALSGMATGVCIIGANVLNRRQQASIASAYAMLSTYHNQYRGKLKELCGEETEETIKSEMLRIQSNFHPTDCDTPDCKVTFYDEFSDRFFDRYEREVIDAEYHFNRNFVLSGIATVNDLYEMLGLDKTENGDDVGWSMDDGYYWVDFEHHLINRDDGGSDVYAIVFSFSPEPLSEYDQIISRKGE